MNKSNFVGFLDSFRSNNISVMDPSISYHIDEISENLLVIVNYLDREGKTAHKEQYEKFYKIIKDGRNNRAYSDLIYLGEGLKTLLESTDDAIILKYLKRILYHYLLLAEESKSKKLLALAISLGEMYSDK